MFYSLKNWPWTCMCNHKSLQAHRGTYPPHDTKCDMTSTNGYLFKNRLPCWGIYQLSHEQEMLNHLFKNCRCCQTLQDISNLGLPAFQNCHIVKAGWGAMTVLGDLRVLLHKGWVCCSAGLAALRGQMNFHGQDYKSFPCKPRLISITNQGEWEPLLLVSVQKFCTHQAEPSRWGSISSNLSGLSDRFPKEGLTKHATLLFRP